MLIQPDNQEPWWISKERLECIGQLPDVMEVVVEAQQLFNTSESTNEDRQKMKTQSKQKLGKHKRIPIPPTQKWKVGGYSQSLSLRSRFD